MDLFEINQDLDWYEQRKVLRIITSQVKLIPIKNKIKLSKMSL